jgi:preprotein translocase subunit SecB
VFAPIQPQDIRLIELHVVANPNFEDPGAAQYAPRLKVREEVLADPFGREKEAAKEVSAETGAIPLHLDVETVFVQLLREEIDGTEGESETEADEVFYRVVLLLSINEEEDVFERAPYQAEIALMGDFGASQAPTDPEERARVFKVLRANGASMLYGTARQSLLQNTETSLHASLLLPSLSFREIIEHESAVEDAEAASGEGAPAEEE